MWDARRQQIQSIATRLGEMGRLLWRAADRSARTWCAIALACVVTSGFAAGLAPLALKAAIDRLADTGPYASTGVTVAIALYVAALLVQRLAEQAQLYAFGRGDQRLGRRISTLVFTHMLALPIAYHVQGRSGALPQMLSEGVLGARLILTHLTVSLAPAAVQLTVAAAVMTGVFGPNVGLLFALALTAYGVVFAHGVGRTTQQAQSVSAAQIDVGGVTADGLMNVEAIKAFTAEPLFSGRYDAALRHRETHFRGLLARRLENGLAVSVVFGLAVAASLLIGGWAVARGGLGLGAFVLLNAYLLQLLRPLELLGYAVRDMGQGAAQMRRLLDVLAQAPEADTRLVDSRPPPPGAAELAFENVDFGYTADRAILSDLSFKVRAGDVVGVVGPSGAGKSSLLRLILRFYRPSRGRILLDGAPIEGLPLGDLRNQIALVSQDTILLNDTIAANIALGARTATDAEIAQAVATARLTDLVARLPDGLATPVGERGLKLSGGEKQRVAIARAVLRRARLVILDEATAALDPATERLVWAALADLGRQATIVAVTHRLTSLAQADEILVLDRGRIVERGKHSALLARQGRYAELWQAQRTDRPGS